ncbi:MAG TPA: pyridoxamine 5'-phosphate oxidase family protein [Beijerinckiaceae bacterium]|jgi:general stress protein 26
MPTSQELKEKLWSKMRSDMTVMLGLVGAEHGHRRPMTAQFDTADQPIWFFSSTDAELVAKLMGASKPAAIAFESRGHDFFASISGDLRVDNDRAVIERLWNSHVAAWYEHGKTDPKLALLRFDPREAEIWEDSSSIVAGVKALLGIDPQDDAQDKVAKVKL